MACEASRALPAPRPASPALPDSEKMLTAVTADDYLAHRRV